MNNKELQDLRIDYAKHSLSEHEVDRNPIEQFKIWFKEAIEAQVSEPNAMTLATVDEHGQPKTRIVLIKEMEDDGIVFYTNYESDKGKEMELNPKVSICFFWRELERQVRIEGVVEKIPESQSTEYFLSRPEGSQIGAWASEQSQVIESRTVLESRFKEAERKFKGQDIERPPHWGGYKVRSTAFEYWQGRMSRLHDRVKYEWDGKKWNIFRLSP